MKCSSCGSFARPYSQCPGCGKYLDDEATEAMAEGLGNIGAELSSLSSGALQNSKGCASLFMFGLVLAVLQKMYELLIVNTSTALLFWLVSISISLGYILNVQEGLRFSEKSALPYIFNFIWIILIIGHVEWESPSLYQGDEIGGRAVSSNQSAKSTGQKNDLTYLQSNEVTQPSWCSNAKIASEIYLCETKELWPIEKERFESYQKLNKDTRSHPGFKMCSRALYRSMYKCKNNTQCIGQKYRKMIEVYDQIDSTGRVECPNLEFHRSDWTGEYQVQGTGEETCVAIKMSKRTITGSYHLFNRHGDSCTLIDFRAKYKHDGIWVFNDKNGCEIRFKQESDSLTIEFNDQCTYYCGARAYISNLELAPAIKTGKSYKKSHCRSAPKQTKNRN